MREEVVKFVYEVINNNLDQLDGVGVVMVGLTNTGEIHLELEEESFVINIEEN
jgi:hypothetical protein